MLIIGDRNCIPNNQKGDFIIYNLISTIGTYPIVDIVPNARDFDYSDEKDFDMKYASFIFNDDYFFYEFFDKIIYPLYNGYNIYLIIDRNNISDAIAESITKLIQQRYAYNSAIVNEPEDLDYVNKDESFGSLQGIYNLDIDKERYSILYTALNSYATPNGEIKIRGYENC